MFTACPCLSYTYMMMFYTYTLITLSSAAQLHKTQINEQNPSSETVLMLVLTFQ